MQGQARKKDTTSSLKDQKNSFRQKSSKQPKLRITGSCSTSTFTQGKELFYTELGFGLIMQKMRTYSCRKGLENPSAVSFTVRRELNSFEIISCFMDKIFNICIELGIVPLPTGCDGFCTGQDLSSQQPILVLYLPTPIHLLKRRISVEAPSNISKFCL